MIQGLVNATMDELKKKYRLRARIEGLAEDGWILLDYGEIILHIFSPHRRDYYRLEELWSQGKILLHVQ